MMINLEEIRPFLSEHIPTPGRELLINIILLVGIAAVSVAVYYLTVWALRLLDKLIQRSPTKWDDDMLNARMFAGIAQLAPALSVNWLIPGLFGASESSVHWLSSLTSLYIVWAFMHIVIVVIDNLYHAFERRPQLKPYAIASLFQMVKLVVYCIAAIVALSLLIGKSPLVIITALGASAAVLMLIFQDTILGLVASIQLTGNDMLKRGDWIEDKAHDINGEVMTVTLTAVKVRNWDNSVSTIPPYSLMKSSFRNYEPMRLSGGRRVDRSINIDMNTIRFLSAGELSDLREKGFVDDTGDTRTVNLRLLRDYLTKYLEAHPDVNHSMLTMVRQMPPSTAGLPVNLYFFLNQTSWDEYEAKTGEIFDHVYAIVTEFGLRIFQTPAGSDISAVRKE